MAVGYDPTNLSLPLVELHVRGLGEHFNQCIALHSSEIVERIQRTVKETVEAFDFEAFTKMAVNEALINYMTKGSGSEAISDLASDLGDKMLKDLLKGKKK